MDAKMITIIHAQKGEIEVKENLAELFLKHNHVEKGGSYCSLDEAHRYFEEYAPKATSGTGDAESKPKRRGGRRKKAVENQTS